MRMTAAITEKYNLKLWQIDFVGAYLNSFMKEDIYMKQPEGFIKPGFEDYVCKLVHTIYGMMQGGHVGTKLSVQHSISSDTPHLAQTHCYDFRRLRQSLTVVVSKVQSQMSLEECKSWTCIVLLGLRVKVQVKGLSIKD